MPISTNDEGRKFVHDEMERLDKQMANTHLPANMASDIAPEGEAQEAIAKMIATQHRVSPGQSRIVTITIFGGGFGIGAREREDQISGGISTDWGLVFQLRAIGVVIRHAYGNHLNTEQVKAVIENAEHMTLEAAGEGPKDEQISGKYRIGRVVREGMLAALLRVSAELDEELQDDQKGTVTTPVDDGK